MRIEMPVTLRMGDLMSNDEFFQFCKMNDTLQFERDSQGNIIVMSPTGKVQIYAPGKSVIAYDALSVVLPGEDILPGFVLDLSSIVK
jgi:hypothetical protein